MFSLSVPSELGGSFVGLSFEFVSVSVLDSVAFSAVRTGVPSENCIGLTAAGAASLFFGFVDCVGSVLGSSLMLDSGALGVIQASLDGGFAVGAIEGGTTLEGGMFLQSLHLQFLQGIPAILHRHADFFTHLDVDLQLQQRSSVWVGLLFDVRRLF